MYVADKDLTNTYIQSLISRNGFIDVTLQYQSQNIDGWVYAIQDLEGSVSFYYDMASTRDDMIRKYLIIQNG